MLDLSRTVRFCLNAGGVGRAAPRANGFSAWPAVAGLGRYFELTVTCRGRPHPATGYFINIKHIDDAVRANAVPLFVEALDTEAGTGAPAALGTLLRRVLDNLQPPLDEAVTAITLQLTPVVSLTLHANAMAYVTIRQQYEFSAAHRLHVTGYSDEANRATFGKCNNPAGHGHNYRVEVAVRVPIDPRGHTLDVQQLDEHVDAALIEPLDHKHLNLDIPAFADRNPSVEHIVQTGWAMLADKLPAGVELEELTVWETGKTACTYRGG